MDGIRLLWGFVGSMGLCISTCTFPVLPSHLIVPLYCNRSFWTLSGSPSLLSHSALLAIAQSANITPAQAVYRISQLEGIVPLSGTKDETHMREDLEVQDVQLDEDGLDWAFDEVREFIR